MTLSLRLLAIALATTSAPVFAQTAPDKSFVDTGEAQIAYIEGGDPDGRPILFVHGLPFSSFIWREVMSALPQGGYRLIAPDLAGFGDSEAGAGLYGVDDQVRHLTNLVDALDLSEITVVGHDWGAGIGLMYAAENAQDVSSFAFFEGAMPPVYPRPGYDEMPDRVAGMFRSLREQDAEINVLQNNIWLDVILPTMTASPLSGAVRAEYDRPFATPNDRVPLLEMSRSLPIAGEPSEVVAAYSAAAKWWTTSEIPKLVLYAAPGRLYPEDLARWNETHAKSVTVTGIGMGLHALQEEAPDAVAAALEEWLATLAPK